MRRVALFLVASTALACGDDGGGATIDAGPDIDSAIAPAPDASTAADCVPKSGTTLADLRLQEVTSGLSKPVFVTAPPGDTRLFVLEQAGRIRLVENGTLTDTPFLDISDRVNDAGGEQGLLGLAFHPGWSTNGKFYVYYTGGTGNGETVVAEYEVNAVDASTADKATETILLTEPQPFQNHNGGMIAFGQDGYLYIGLGDGGSGSDPGQRAQNPSVLLGSMLRIDVDNPGSGKAYGIPEDNPFADGNGGAPEVYAYGLRNPWRWSFDRMTGDAYIADVGQNRVEEVNAITVANMNGANFGWDVYEGSECFNDGADPKILGTGCTLTGTVQPIIEYGHTPTTGLTPPPADPAGNAITGGYVYRGACLPDLQGTYFYGDFVTNITRTLKWNGSAATDTQDITSTLQMGVGLGGVASFGEDGFGELYLASFNGSIYRIVAP